MCGGSTPGWRWLDVRALAADLVARRQDWPAAAVERVVYCTAMIDRATNAVGHGEQDTYIRALRTGVVDRVEFGHRGQTSTSRRTCLLTRSSKQSMRRL